MESVDHSSGFHYSSFSLAGRLQLLQVLGCEVAYAFDLDKLANRNAAGQAELESLLPILNSTSDPDLLIAWWYLGELYRAQGRADSAVSAYAQYLKATEGNSDPPDSLSFLVYSRF